jgi:hypothetical protein
MSPSTASRPIQRVGFGLAVLVGLASMPVLVEALTLAANSLEPYVDTPRIFYAVAADFLLMIGAALSVVGAIAVSRVDAWQRIARRYGPLLYAGAALLVALPLAKAASNDAYLSSIGRGEPSLGLLCVGALGIATALAVLIARRVWLELIAAATLPVILLVVAAVRDT